MNTRSCLLNVGVSALLATGSVLTAAPASAAPGSTECVSAQAALSAQIGVAAVDIALANQLRSAIAAFESIGAQLEPLYVEADLAVADEVAALDKADLAAYDASVAEIAARALLATAESTESDAKAELADAEAVLEVFEGDSVALDEAEERRNQALALVDIAAAATLKAQTDADAALATLRETETTLNEANEAFLEAAEVAYGAPEILALEAQFDTAVVSFDDAFTRLGLTEGTDPQDLLALADAAAAACSAPAVAHTPVIRAAAPQQRGMNIQTAAHDAGAAGPANLALLAGLAGFGAAAAAGSAVVARRRGADRA